MLTLVGSVNAVVSVSYFALVTETVVCVGGVAVVCSVCLLFLRLCCSVVFLSWFAHRCCVAMCRSDVIVRVSIDFLLKFILARYLRYEGFSV